MMVVLRGEKKFFAEGKWLQGYRRFFRSRMATNLQKLKINFFFLKICLVYGLVYVKFPYLSAGLMTFFGGLERCAEICRSPNPSGFIAVIY